MIHLVIVIVWKAIVVPSVKSVKSDIGKTAPTNVNNVSVLNTLHVLLLQANALVMMAILVNSVTDVHLVIGITHLASLVAVIRMG